MNNSYITELAQKYEILLGSGSPRRVKLLSELNIKFKQVIPNIDETILINEDPYKFVLRMASQKGNSLVNQLTDNQLAITCDTIVILNNKVLGKPKDSNDAFEILTALSGNKHEVATSIAISNCQGSLVADFESTTVYFHKVSPDQIKEYIATGEPLDKAGAYGIQGMGAFLVDTIEGNLDTVVGFPRKLLSKLANKLLRQGL